MRNNIPHISLETDSVWVPFQTSLSLLHSRIIFTVITAFYGKIIRTGVASVSIRITNLYHCDHAMLWYCRANLLNMTKENILND